jgi:hypothetical protein
MAQVTTVVLIPQKAFPGPPGATIVFAGDKQQAAAYYLSGNDLQTITWSVGQGNNYSNQNSQPNNTFTGTITIQASLATDPQETDWFDATVLSISTSTLPQVGYTNLRGNYIWIRARVTGWTAGAINQVTASY